MKILLGFSGGFDSTYAAKSMISEGYEVQGAVLVMHDSTDLDRARENAALVGIPLYEVDVRERFHSIVIDNFVNEYSRGRTPNPCILCNPTVKFHALYELAMEHGFDKIATGHYASIVDYTAYDGITRRTIRMGADRSKDQSYMLYRLPREIVNLLYFPLAEEVKSDLRLRVRDTALHSIDSPDSQEICFLPDGDYPTFVENALGGSKGGNFVTEDGRIISPHQGIVHYTLGQRKGLGISLGERVFVTNIDYISGDVTLSPSQPRARRLTLTDVHLLGFADGTLGTFELQVMVRYSSPLEAALVTLLGDNRAVVELKTPVKFAAPGQSCVFYDGDVLIGGGIIDTVE